MSCDVKLTTTIVSRRMPSSLQVAGNDFMQRIRDMERGGQAKVSL